MIGIAPRVTHLVARFFASLVPRPLDDRTLAWVYGALEPGERRVWQGLGPADRAESVAVAARLEAALAGTAAASEPRWRAAALLHDAGKQAAGFGPLRRAVATIVAAFAGDARTRAWAGRSGSGLGLVGRYVAHDDLGAELLRAAGARAEVVAWAAAHHRPDRWPDTGIPPAVCVALADADGETIRTM